MKDMGLFEYVLVLGVIAAAVVLCFALLFPLFSGERSDTAKCYEAGYPDTRYYYDEVYCVKRENGSDVVRPVSEVE